jgi:hypothetical protein
MTRLRRVDELAIRKDRKGVMSELKHSFFVGTWTTAGFILAIFCWAAGHKQPLGNGIVFLLQVKLDTFEMPRPRCHY